MRTFKKSSKLDHVCYDVRGPVLDEANRMQADGIDVLKLNIGNPAPFGFSAPEEVITDMISRDIPIPMESLLQERQSCSMRRQKIFQMCQWNIFIPEMVSVS